MSGLKFRKPNYEKARRELEYRKEICRKFHEFIEESQKVSYESMMRPVDI